MDGLTKRSGGMSMAVKCVFACLHQMVNTTMSQAYTSSGRLKKKSSSLILSPLGNLSKLHQLEIALE